MTGSDDTPSKDGGRHQRLDPCWIPFAVAVRRVELGLGIDEKSAKQTVLQIGGKIVRIADRKYPDPGSGILPAWVPGSDFYHADDLEDFIRDQRSRLEGAADQGEQAPVQKDKGGAPRQYDWDGLGAAFGTWLHQELGRTKLRFSQHYKIVCDLAAELGDQPPSEGSVRPYLKKWLNGHRKALKLIEKHEKKNAKT
jgi:hypothetical protein